MGLIWGKRGDLGKKDGLGKVMVGLEKCGGFGGKCNGLWEKTQVN